ncbi:MAG: IS256 family transposase, partial [Candidatus Omnitrophica bacterium]|nr:IS256 family transposase [Candidatus Omnitrophota bacterium]
MKRPVNFSKDNLSVQWQYVNRNLKDMGLWKLVETRVKLTIKGTIELMVQKEFDMTLASSKYERTGNRIDYRSGYYQRFIGTTHGKVEISMPKARRTPVKYGLFKKYQRRQEQFDDNILKAMILGLTGRKQKKFFKSFIGDSVSHTTASKIIGKIGCLVNYYRNMPLSDEYEYLYLDAIWVHVKELNIKSRPILVALGVKSDGSKHILTFKLAKSESEAEWLGLINDLYRRGLKGLKLNLIISDNCGGLKSAINYVYPYTALQLCTVHKLRNVLSKINNKTENRKKVMNHACKIFKSQTKAEAFVRYKKFIRNWSIKEPRVVKTMKNDIEYYFTYFNFAEEKRNLLKSTNPLERINRELRKVSRRYGYFQSQRSLDIFIYLTLKEDGLITNRDFEVMPEQKQNL